MKPSVNNVTSNQPKMLSKREAKKSVNRKSHGVLFFQIGLILSLIAAIFAMEINIGSPAGFKIKKSITIDEPLMRSYVIEKEQFVSQPIAKIEKLRPKVKPIIIDKKIIILDNTTPVVDNLITTKAPIVVAPVIVASARVEKPVDTNRTINLNEVEFVPVFPGCESLTTKEEKKVCMNSKINAFISRKFKSDRFSGLKKNATHNIYVQFTIDKDGNVQEVIARAPDKQMQKEGVRVLSKLPKMIPGKMGTQNVPVSYMVPITFRVH
ncbi:MAG: protein TonB [Patiriisocius sp.]|jgi:protein TonB